MLAKGHALDLCSTILDLSFPYFPIRELAVTAYAIKFEE